MKLSEKQIAILSHTLGIDNGGNIFRNHYCAFQGNDSWEDLLKMVDTGLMHRSSNLDTDLPTFHATCKGVDLIKAAPKS